MNVFEIIGVVLLSCYILLTLISIFVNKKLSYWGKFVFICACIFLLTFIICLILKNKLILLLLPGLVLLHIGAIIGGLQIHGKLNWPHHIIRLAFSICLLVLFII